jgi:hypothetical protein
MRQERGSWAGEVRFNPIPIPRRKSMKARGYSFTIVEAEIDERPAT